MDLEARAWKNNTILIVEDNEDSFTLIEIILKRLEPKLIHAKNGIEAVELCKTNKEIDVVLMDINLPLLNGYEATEQIKKFRKELPVIAQTAYAMGEEMDKCFDAGCDDYIPKPINREILFTKLNKYVENKIN